MDRPSGFHRYKESSRWTKFFTTLVSIASLGGLFWFFDRRHDKGPLGVHDSVVIVAGMLVVMAIAFPDRLAKIGGMLSRTKLGRGDEK